MPHDKNAAPLYLDALFEALKLKPGESVILAILKLVGPNDSSGVDAASKDDLDALVARTTPAEFSLQVKEMTHFYRAVLDMDRLPYATRIARITALKPSGGTDLRSRVVGLFLRPTSIEAVARATSRTTASLRAMECLLALKRWQMSHRGSPKDLASLARGAGLKSVPIDPYDGKPFKFATVDGRPIVYSIGRDGQDDGGLVDSNRDQKPVGDLIYRLPATEEQHVLKP